jgi:hypothetical protein
VSANPRADWHNGVYYQHQLVLNDGEKDLMRIIFHHANAKIFHIIENFMWHKINLAVLLQACNHAIKLIEQYEDVYING